MNDLRAAIETQIRNKVRVRQGNDSQTLVGHRLRILGFHCIAPIATPMRKVGGKLMYSAKVSGDFYALWKREGALVEVKRRDAATLSHSDLDPHQHERLSEWEAAGGVSFLAWVNPSQLDSVAIMSWRFVCPHIAKPRTSIPWATAYAARMLTR